MRMNHLVDRDTVGGTLFVALGGATLLYARRYPLGTLTDMGPGYFPTILGAMLVLFGAVIAVASLLTGGAGPIGRGAARPLLAIAASPICFALLLDWIDRYPIVSVEDPLAEDDAPGFAAFTAAAGGRVQVVGDDLLVTEAARIRQAAADRAATAVLLKPNQRGTLTETREAWRAAREVGFAGIVSARSGETEDVTIVHLAVGWGVGQLKVGSFARGERTAKWNEALRIEEALGSRARFAGAAALPRSCP